LPYEYYFVVGRQKVEGLEGACDDFSGCVIASHSIERNTHILLALLLAELEGYPWIDVAAILASGVRQFGLVALFAD